MNKLDNIFKKVISDATLREQYNIDPDEYQNLSQGLQSHNLYVKSIATIIQSIDKTIELDKANSIGRSVGAPTVLSDSAKNALYKKIVTELQREFIMM